MTLAQPLACLLDEDLDPALAGQLAVASGWQVTSVRAEGWLGVKNGPLLQAMAEAYPRGSWVTGDRGLYHQRRAQPLALGIGVVRSEPRLAPLSALRRLHAR